MIDEIRIANLERIIQEGVVPCQATLDMLKIIRECPNYKKMGGWIEGDAHNFRHIIRKGANSNEYCTFCETPQQKSSRPAKLWWKSAQAELQNMKPEFLAAKKCLKCFGTGNTLEKKPLSLDRERCTMCGGHGETIRTLTDQEAIEVLESIITGKNGCIVCETAYSWKNIYLPSGERLYMIGTPDNHDEPWSVFPAT